MEPYFLYAKNPDEQTKFAMELLYVFMQGEMERAEFWSIVVGRNLARHVEQIRLTTYDEEKGMMNNTYLTRQGPITREIPCSKQRFHAIVARLREQQTDD